MPRLVWTQEKILNWKIQREFFRVLDKDIGEMRIFESIAALQLNLKRQLTSEQQLRVEARATEIINNSLNNVHMEKVCIDLVREMLETADACIISGDLKFNNKLLSASCEVELVFKFMREVQIDEQNIPSIIGGDNGRLGLFQQLLIFVMDRYHEFGFKNIPDSVLLYSSVINEYDDSHVYNMSPTYTPHYTFDASSQVSHNTQEEDQEVESALQGPKQRI